MKHLKRITFHNKQNLIVLNKVNYTFQTKTKPIIRREYIPTMSYFFNPFFFKILKPADKFSVVIDQYQLNEKILYASQDGKRTDFTTSELIKSYLKHPLMTFKIIAAIHFEAFKLWTKGIKFIQKKLKIRNNISFEN